MDSIYARLAAKKNWSLVVQIILNNMYDQNPTKDTAK